MATESLFPFNASSEEGPEQQAPKKRGRKASDKVSVAPGDYHNLLTDADRQALDEEAERHVAEDFKKEARQKYLKEAILKQRTLYNPEEEIVSILIDLPGHASCLKINGREYFHGSTYDVPMSLFRSMIEMISRAWQHEDVVGGINRDKYMKPARNFALRPGMESFQHPNSTIMRV